MAVLMTHRWPGGTETQYRATIATVHPPDGLPEGQLRIPPAFAEGRYLIAVVWGYKKCADSFVSDVPWRACRWREGSRASPRSALPGFSTPRPLSNSTRVLG